MNNCLLKLPLFALLIASSISAQSPKPVVQVPDEITIGRHSFIDIGPPFDFYEVITLRSTNNNVRVERATLAPAGDTCFQHATVETATADVDESMVDVLGGINPCTVSEKELQHEVKRCKRCAVFSGSDVTMQLECEGKPRSIRMNILDRDMFDAHANTPRNTSWSMELMTRLDKVLGSNVLDKPVFTVTDTPNVSPIALKLKILTDVSNGKYDTLFESRLDKPSVLLKDAQRSIPTPSVVLLGSTPFQPIDPVLPKYPPIARAAKVNGTVVVSFDVSSDGMTSNLNFLSGPLMFRGPLSDAVKIWRFPEEANGDTIEATIGFNTNCPAKK